MSIKHYLQPWILITIGILMNIISAIVTHYFISQNNTELYAIQQKITTINSNIESQWQTKNEMERKKEFVLLLLNSQSNLGINPEINTYLKHYFSTLKKHYLSKEDQLKPPKMLSIDSAIKLTESAQKKVIDNINDQYFEKLELEASEIPFKDNNAILYSVAIFMQLIGLILVLSRDLARQP